MMGHRVGRLCGSVAGDGGGVTTREQSKELVGFTDRGRETKREHQMRYFPFTPMELCHVFGVGWAIYRYYNMRADIILEFEYRNVAIWHMASVVFSWF